MLSLAARLVLLRTMACLNDALNDVVSKAVLRKDSRKGKAACGIWWSFHMAPTATTSYNPSQAASMICRSGGLVLRVEGEKKAVINAARSCIGTSE